MYIDARHVLPVSDRPDRGAQLGIDPEQRPASHPGRCHAEPLPSIGIMAAYVGEKAVAVNQSIASFCRKCARRQAAKVPKEMLLTLA